jgi:hypothetical protein
MMIDFMTNTLCDCNYRGNIWLQNEKHHWGYLGAGIRYYINPKSSITIFVDGKFRGDWLIGTTIKNDDIKKTNWDAFGYRRFAPGFEFAIGGKWKRLALSLGYQSNIARTFTRDAGEYDPLFTLSKQGFWHTNSLESCPLQLLKLDNRSGIGWFHKSSRTFFCKFLEPYPFSSHHLSP